MTDFNSVSRSKFLVTARLSAGTIISKDCMDNLPEEGSGNTQNTILTKSVANINPKQALEKLKVSWMDMMFN